MYELVGEIGVNLLDLGYLLLGELEVHLSFVVQFLDFFVFLAQLLVFFACETFLHFKCTNILIPFLSLLFQLNILSLRLLQLLNHL